jgi:polyisoprenoid-binding protein YceI
MFKRTAVFVAALFVFALQGQAADWKVDPAHSSVGFWVKHLVISKVHGAFGQFNGTITFDPENLKDGSAEMTIQVASIDTKNENRNNHLKSPDFFDVETYPVITFVSKKVIPGEGNLFQLVGDLTIKDVTNEVTFDCVFNGSIDGPGGKPRAAFSAEAVINRQDFNITWSKVTEAGGLVVSDEVHINIDLEVVQI